MAAQEQDEAAQAGFNNPFNTDSSSASGPGADGGQVSPQETRSIAVHQALKEDVAPTEAVSATAASPPGPTPADSQTPANNLPVRFAGADARPGDVSSTDDIEKLSTHSSPASDSSASHGGKRGEAIDKIKTTATKVADKFHLSSVQVTGPSRLFNPTNVRARLKWANEADEKAQRDADYDLLWRARDNRKGRGSIAVRSSIYDHAAARRGPTRQRRSLVHVKNIATNLRRMFTTFPYWDMAFWGGWSYTIGSALFVIDGAFAWTPAAFPENEFPGEETYGVPLCFFFGAIFFQIGATMAYFEAINDGSFHGSAMKRLMEGHENEQHKMLDEKLRSFFGGLSPHHRHDAEGDEAAEDELAANVDPEAGWKTKDRKERPGSIYPPAKHPGRRRGAVDMGEAEEGQSSTYLTWRWWPSWYALRTHHIYEIGYVAVTIHLFGVKLYGVTSIIILPGILDSFTPAQELGGYWIPQMVAAACFLIASVMFTLETQERWWKPEVKVLGWWIGFWSVVGSVGFELCAAFGPASGERHWALYQSNLSSMWGSCAYTVGSFLQWYEALNKHPVQEMFEEPGEMKSWQVHPI